MLASGTAGNLTSDAHLAAMAIERGATVCSTDHDFRRLSGMRHANPIAEMTSRDQQTGQATVA